LRTTFCLTIIDIDLDGAQNVGDVGDISEKVGD